MYFIFTFVFVSLIWRKEQTKSGINKNPASWDKNTWSKSLPGAVSEFVLERRSAKGELCMLNLDLLFSVVLEKRSDQAPKLTSKAEWEGRRSHPRGRHQEPPSLPSPSRGASSTANRDKDVPRGLVKSLRAALQNLQPYTEA